MIEGNKTKGDPRMLTIAKGDPRMLKICELYGIDEDYAVELFSVMMNYTVWTYNTCREICDKGKDGESFLMSLVKLVSEVLINE